MNAKKETGLFGEEKAAAYLQEHGYEILERNFRCRLGEIDIIARGGGYLIFAEVKLRKSAAFAEAREFVTKSKQRKVKNAALYYLSGHNTSLQPRFDVIEVYPNEKELPMIIHLEDAFC